MLTLRASVFWKNVQGIYLGCNDVMAEKFSAQSSRHEIIGIDDIELVGVQAAKVFIDNDSAVISEIKPRVVYEPFRSVQGVSIRALSTKAPLFDVEGNLIGLWGISFFEEVEEDQLSRLKHMTSDMQNQYGKILCQSQRLANHYHRIHYRRLRTLSARETQCLQLVAKGMSAKAISEKLELSKRTVESYIESTKAKLGCINKTELIIAAIKHKYIDIESS